MEVARGPGGQGPGEHLVQGEAGEFIGGHLVLGFSPGPRFRPPLSRQTKSNSGLEIVQKT